MYAVDSIAAYERMVALKEVSECIRIVKIVCQICTSVVHLNVDDKCCRCVLPFTMSVNLSQTNNTPIFRQNWLVHYAYFVTLYEVRKHKLNINSCMLCFVGRKHQASNVGGQNILLNQSQLPFQHVFSNGRYLFIIRRIAKLTT